MFLKHITTKAVTNKNKNSVVSVHTTDWLMCIRSHHQQTELNHDQELVSLMKLFVYTRIKELNCNTIEIVV